MDGKSADIERRARAAEQNAIANSGNGKASLEAIIKSTELYFQALRVTENGQDRKRLQTKVKSLLVQAERLRAAHDGAPAASAPKKTLIAPISTRKLTTRQDIILLEGAKLNGFIFKPWTSEPAPEEFVLRDGEPMFTDSMMLPLSAEQLESFDGWKRPQEALPSVYSDADGAPSGGQATVMYLPVAMDLVQDMTSDCSVVASLCALTSRVQRGFPKVRNERI
jgi:calpain-7